MKRSKLKLLIDISLLVSMAATLASLLPPDRIIHEIAGLITLSLIFLHLALNWGWVKGTANKLFKGELKDKFSFILFILLTVTLIATLATGISVSTFLNTSEIEMHQRHTVPAVIFLALCIMHVIRKLPYLKRMLLKKPSS
jgi:succinate dehydrogenase hydrophobic anchor subunit